MRQRVDTWSLGWKRSALATIIARAPISTFAETNTTAFPRLGALLGTFIVYGLKDGAVLIVGEDGAVFGPVVLPK
jgi:hypothetical protein